MVKTVCIVGAGPAGLVSAKTLLQSKNFNVTVYEKANRIGGIWALDEDTRTGFLSPETPTNLSRFTVGFSDLDWNAVDLSDVPSDKTSDGSYKRRRAPIFPKAWQVNRYLETYRRNYIPEEAIRLGHQVVKAERVEHGDKHQWRIYTQDDKAGEQSVEYDFSMLCSGFFASPRPLSTNVPVVSPDLGIKAIHSSQFRKVEDLFADVDAVKGKTILVIGGGNSAGEAAAAVAQQLSNAKSSPETGPRQSYKDCKILHVTPRPLYAIPPFTPCDDTYTTFTPVDLKLYDLSRRPLGPIAGNAGRVTKAIKDMIHGAVQGMIGGDQSDLGCPAITIPSEEPRSTVCVALSESYPEFVRSGLIEVVGGRITSIKYGESGCAIASWKSDGLNGQIEDIGAVVYATGYTPATAVEFLPEDVKHELNYDPSSLRLPLILQGWQTMTAAVPELAAIGFYEGPYWPMIEMQARLTALRWSKNLKLSSNPYEETSKLLELRGIMQARGVDVPQYWFGDYAGYMEELAAFLGLQRNDGAFAEREGCVSPARYLSASSNKADASSIMEEIFETWRTSNEDGRFVARAVFRALQGKWKIERTIASSLPSFPSGTLDGEASFYPRLPTMDKSGQIFDLEYLYVESGTLSLENGYSMPARRRYVYRYCEERDELSAWFVKPDSDFEVDYLFHNFNFVSPDIAKKEGACLASADHPCVDDMYYTEYRLPMKGISLHEFQVKHEVKGPSKDYVATTRYSRSPKDTSQSDSTLHTLETPATKNSPKTSSSHT